MSDSENPYASPQTEIVPENKLIDRPLLNDTMTGYLKEASPWLRFLGIIGYINCGILVLACIGSFAGMREISALWDAIPDIGALGDTFTSIFSASLGMNFLVFAVLFFFPSRFVYNFGAKIRSYFQNGKEQELELALKNNRTLWKYMGIITIISLAMIPILIVIIIVIAVVSVFI